MLDAVARLNQQISAQADGFVNPPGKSHLIIDAEAPPVLSYAVFNNALTRAGFIDPYVNRLPGAVVVLPAGMSSLRKLLADTTARLESVGLQEYDYPYVTDVQVYEPVQHYLNPSTSLIFAQSAKEIEQGKRATVIHPTGEHVVFHHWARMTFNANHPNVRMFRRARYYRPSRHAKWSGHGVFHGLESADIHEVFCGFVREDDARRQQHELVDLFNDLLNAYYLPVIWSVRPLWGNNHYVSLETVAADMPLPFMATAQLSSVYDHGQLFSRVYGIRAESGTDESEGYLQTIAAYVSRRMWFAALSLGMRQDGTLFVPPRLAAPQVRFIYRDDDDTDDRELKTVMTSLQHAGLSSTLQRVARADIKRAVQEAYASGVPMIVVIHAKRHANDPYKVILQRTDTMHEQQVMLHQLTSLPNLISSHLEQLDHQHQHRVTEYAMRRQRAATTLAEVHELLQRRQVVRLPLSFTREAVEMLEGRGNERRGEVLGFQRGVPAPCLATGEVTDCVALMSPRI